MEEDRIKWNSRYDGDGFFIGPEPSRYLAEQIDLIASLAPGKKALDLACGEGRNSIFLARHGFRVTGLDISEKGLAKGERRAHAEGVAVDFRRVDLDDYRFTESWDLIVDFNFLQRDLIPAMVAALNPGGLIVFDSILDTPDLEGIHTRSYLLLPGELPRLFAPFAGKIIHAEESPEGPVPTTRLIFRKHP